MNLKNLRVVGFIGLLLFAGCAALQDMDGGSSGRHYTSKSFSISAGSSDSISFNINAPGSISAYLSTRGLASSETGGADSVAMALQSPTQAEMVRSEGNPHEKLKIRYRVPRSAQEGMWKVVLTNNSQRTISGTLKVYYPYEDTAGTTASQGSSGGNTGTETTAQNDPVPQQDTWSSQGGGYSGEYEDSQPPPPASENYPPSQQTASSGGYGTGQQAPQQSPSQTQQAPQPSEQPQQQPQQAPQTTASRKILVVNPAVLRTATATRPVRYGVVLNTFDLTMRDDRRDKFYFHVRREGTIDVYVRWQKNARLQKDVKLAVILNGPSQENALARKDGLHSVHLRYQVKKSDIVSGRQWKVTIARFDEFQATGNLGRDLAQLVPITGNLQIRYPKE